MKRFLSGIALVGFLLSLAGTAQAQVAGIFGGVDLANLGGDADEFFQDELGASLSNKLGFSGGAYVGFDLHPMFRLVLAGQYVQKGAKSGIEGVDLKLKLDYIEFLLPLTLKIPVEGSSITPRIYVGPSLGFEMTCKISGEEGGVSVSLDCPDGTTKSLDYGVFGGVGVDFGIGTGAITLDALYNLGLADINDEEASDLTVKNQNIQFLIGYQFSFGT